MLVGLAHAASYSLVNKKTIEYEYEAETECACKNGGICALDNDFCVCPADFTGRRCELNLNVDARLGCGQMLNNEDEYLECAKCKCSRNLLTCMALSTPTCDLKLFLSKANAGLVERLKGGNLVMLLSLMNSIETYAYQFYINLYKSRHDYQVVYVDVNEAKHKRQLVDPQQNQLVVYQSDNQRLIGIHFRHKVTHNGDDSDVNDRLKPVNAASQKTRFGVVEHLALVLLSFSFLVLI